MKPFIDYYAVLGIAQDAAAAEIKTAFKKQSLKWHPDRNPGIDVHKKMQDINEARRILLDCTLRGKYDREYNGLKANATAKKKKSTADNERKNQPTNNNYSFDLRSDDDLIRICANAIKYKLEFIGAVIQELYKRNYTRETISARVRKRNGTTR